MPSCILARFFLYFQKINKPTHKTLSLIFYTQTPPFNAHADVYSGTRALHDGLHLQPCLMYVSREVSDKSTRLHRWDFG